VTDPTMAALDAAVKEAREVLLDETRDKCLQLYGGMPPHPISTRKYARDVAAAQEALAALIAAAEARGAARERGRECVWEQDAQKQLWSKCNATLEIKLWDSPCCPSCGGRVRVEDVGDE
jgi:hypothetical protein